MDRIAWGIWITGAAISVVTGVAGLMGYKLERPIGITILAACVLAFIVGLCLMVLRTRSSEPALVAAQRPPKNLPQFWWRVFRRAGVETFAAVFPRAIGPAFSNALAFVAGVVVVWLLRHKVVEWGFVKTAVADDPLFWVVLLLLSVVLILLSTTLVRALLVVPYAMWCEAAEPEPLVFEEHALGRAVPIVEMNMNLGHVARAAPWLHFGGLAFNGSGGPVSVDSAKGTIEVGGVGELHNLLELNPDLPIAPCHNSKFFHFEVRVALNDRAAGQLKALADKQGDIPVFFHRAAIVMRTAYGARFKLQVPKPLYFKNIDGTYRAPDVIGMTMVGKVS